MSEYRIPLGYVRGPAGTAGKNFEFKKTYTSVSAMNADFSGTDTSTGDYVLIAATSADDSDNGRLYRKGESTWIYVARINGPTGAQGQRGPMPPLVTDLNVTVSGEGALDASVGPRIAERLIANGGDAAENMVTFSSSDTDDTSAITGYETMPVFEKGQSGSENRLKTLFATISKAVKNIRYIIKLMGSTDISAIGSGTVTDILSALNSGKFDKANVVNNLTTQNAGYSLDARQGRALSTSISSLNDALGSVSSSAANAQTRMSPTATDNLKYTTRGNGFRLTKWDPNTLNIPASNTWGICAQFDLDDGSNHWYNNLAFSTVGRMYYSNKTNNGAWSAWVDITNAMQIYADANKAINAIAYESSLNKFTFRDAKTNQWHQITID